MIVLKKFSFFDKLFKISKNGQVTLLLVWQFVDSVTWIDDFITLDLASAHWEIFTSLQNTMDLFYPIRFDLDLR